MAAARCMAVAYVENLPPFFSPGAAIAEAIFSELPGLQVALVPSSLRDMYVRFLSEEDRELAVLHHPFHLEGATVRLVREEESDRVPCDMYFGTTLEVDAACLTGTDLAVVRAVVLLKHAQHVPSEVLLTRKPWGARLITIRKVRVWRAADSYDADGDGVGSVADSTSLGSGPPLAATRRHSVVITELVDHAPDAPVAAAPVPLVAKRSPRLALKESQLYELVVVRAMKIRGLRDALGGCTAALQKQVKKHAALASYAKPLRKRAVAVLAALIFASPSSVSDGSDV
ncbi:hypothetical protein ACQ4PT_008507 [Festuca glaucescens]